MTNGLNPWRRSFQVLAGCVRVIISALFIYQPGVIHCQNPPDAAFLFDRIRNAPHLTASQADSAYVQLLKTLDQDVTLYDSLVPQIVIWHYEHASREMNADEKLELLHSYQQHLRTISRADPYQKARYLSLYLPVFNYYYQLDSVAAYLGLMSQQLDLIDTPNVQRLSWWYEKGRLASRQGDFDAGLNFSRRGLDYLRTFFPGQLRLKYMLLNGIGIAYRRLERTDEAILHYESVLNNEWQDLHSVKMNGPFLNNLALSYKDCGDWKDAITRLRQAIRYYQTNFSPTYEDIGSGYDNIAICYEAIGEIDSALTYSYKSLAFIRENMGADHPEQLLPMNSITYTLLLHDRLEEALAMSHQALNLLQSTGWTTDSPEGNYFIHDGFDLFALRIAILETLYDNTLNMDYLRDALIAGEEFMRMTDYAYDHLQNDISKELFQMKHGGVYSACIRNLHTFYGITQDTTLIEKAFQYAEKFKSLELLYAAQKDKADQVYLYKSLNEEYQQHQDSIRFYEEKMLAQASDKESALVRSRLNVMKTSFDLWKEKVRRDHPDYYQLIYHPEPISISDLQQVLPEDQTILSYHVSPDALYLIVINPQSRHFIKKETETDLSQRIAVFRSAASGYFNKYSYSDEEYLRNAGIFTREGQALYQLLLAPVDSLLSDRVTIIVDKALGYIPFDLLVKARASQAHHFNDHHYVLKDHAISYGYSCRLWWDMRSVESVAGFKVLAIAPDFSDTPDISPAQSIYPKRFANLYYNEMEVRDIGSILSGKICVKEEASKEQFIRNAGLYPIIHLATHSKANDEEGDYSYLAFSNQGNDDGILYAEDIYNLDLHAELVTLSACETGLGELRSGEGIISLARAFTFAGARSIMCSLWSVNDQSTSSLMTSFYKHLKEGMPKDVALQHSKLDFLQDMGQADLHPRYWGGFICVGDMDPIRNASRYGSALLFAGILITAALIGILFRKSQPFTEHRK